jgi:hypothetical protein
MNLLSDRAAFARLVTALRPWLDQLVVAGGWAHRLHRLHLLAQAVDHEPLVTLDADIVVPRSVGSDHTDLRDRLVEAGFSPRLLGDCRPPIVHYSLADAESEFYAEFLTNLTGHGDRRDGSPDETMQLGGVSAQKLRDIEVLLLAPWTVLLSEAVGYPVGPGEVEILVPNAVAYIAQKLLALEKRSGAKRGKDLLYIHDTVQLFGAALPALHDVWQRAVQPQLTRRQLTRLRSTARSHLGAVNDAVLEAVEAAGAARRGLHAEGLVAACRLGCDEIFGD